MELLSRVLLRTIEAFEAEHASGPTAAELTADLDIPPEFGHDHLVELLRREVLLGRVSQTARRFQLTTAGRQSLLRDAMRHAPRASDRTYEPTRARP